MKPHGIKTRMRPIRPLFFLMMYLIVHLTAGQNAAIDSLRRSLPGIKDDSIKADMLVNLGWELLLTGQYDSAIHYAGQATVPGWPSASRA